MNGAAIKFENKGSNVHVSNVLSINLNPGVTSRKFAVVFRVDGRNPSDGYRVDRGGIMGWEAIDGGAASAPRTLKEAKALAKAYLARIIEQGTLTPR